MPPPWLPFAILAFVIGVSAERLWTMARIHRVNAMSFAWRAPIQGIAQSAWRLAVAGAFGIAAIAWLAPGWETALGRPDWSAGATLRWVATILFVVSALVVAIAQRQMGASWRIGVPKNGPGHLVMHGLFAWSRNPTFLGLLGVALALFLWSPHIVTAALLAATWTLTLIQVRIEEEALREKHGDAYEQYAARVGRWFGRRSLGDPSR